MFALSELRLMAKLNSTFGFTGTIGNLSFYKMKGSDKIIVRAPGGPDKKKIKTSRRFDIVRRNNFEFGGRGTATKWIRRMMGWLITLGDTSFTSRLGSLMKPLQEMDTVSEFGKRAVLFSKGAWLLNGFHLNEQNNFDSIIRTPVSTRLSRETRSASISIPELIPGINFVVPGEYPMFSIVAVLGVLPDLTYNGHKYMSDGGYDFGVGAELVETAWMPVAGGLPAQSLKLEWPKLLPDNSCSFILSVGISFGKVDANGQASQAKHAGAAKILQTA